MKGLKSLQLKTKAYLEPKWSIFVKTVTTTYYGCSKTPSEMFDYNQFHNILRLFDILPNFPFFTASETMCDYYL